MVYPFLTGSGLVTVKDGRSEIEKPFRAIGSDRLSSCSGLLKGALFDKIYDYKVSGNIE